jgi:hypothetical protein
LWMIGRQPEIHAILIVATCLSTPTCTRSYRVLGRAASRIGLIEVLIVNGLSDIESCQSKSGRDLADWLQCKNLTNGRKMVDGWQWNIECCTCDYHFEDGRLWGEMKRNGNGKCWLLENVNTSAIGTLVCDVRTWICNRLMDNDSHGIWTILEDWNADIEMPWQFKLPRPWKLCCSLPIHSQLLFFLWNLSVQWFLLYVKPSINYTDGLPDKW